MKKTLRPLVVALALACGLTTGGPAFAQQAESSIIVQQPVRSHDRNIEAAAIEKAAAKIGELRGSLEDDFIGQIIREEDLARDHSNLLGFPVIREKSVSRAGNSEMVPII